MHNLLEDTQNRAGCHDVGGVTGVPLELDRLE
jgi:hypothetical protein